MKVTVHLELDDEPLLTRKCMRCGGTDFRAIAHIPLNEDAQYNTAESQTTVPLSICLKCHRIALLQ